MVVTYYIVKILSFLSLNFFVERFEVKLLKIRKKKKLFFLSQSLSHNTSLSLCVSLLLFEFPGLSIS